MQNELKKYRSGVDRQVERLRTYFAKMGLEHDFDQQIEPPGENEPLTELFYYLEMVQDNLRELREKNESHVELLEKRVAERTDDLERQLAVISQHQGAIRELSTPVIKIWEDILVLPLIGTVDTFRAQQISEQLLDAIVENHAEVVIIDITGVPIVDTSVAGHFLMVIQASRMLGAHVILSGMSPANAIAMVRLGIDFKDVRVQSSLSKSLLVAFSLTGRRVTLDRAPN